MSWPALFIVLGIGNLFWSACDALAYENWEHPQAHAEQLYRIQATFALGVLCLAIGIALVVK